MAEYLLFHASAGIAATTGPKRDVIVTLTTPPLVPWVGLLSKRLRGTRFVYWVQDLYPDIAAALGAIDARSWAYKLFNALSHKCLTGADAVVGLGDAMAARLRASSVPAAKLSVIHNWADEKRIHPIPRDRNSFLKRYNLVGKFVVLYAGNLGRAHAFDAVLKAAAALRDEPDLEFLFVGSGAQKEHLVSLAHENRLKVRFIPYEPAEALPDLLNAASLALVTQRPETLGLVVPSKIYGLMAAGRPVLFIGPAESEAATIVCDSHCGAVFAPEDGAGLAEFIRGSRKDPGSLEAMGRAGREWFLQHFTLRRGIAQFVSLFANLLTDARP